MHLRAVTYQDAELLLKWANDPLVRKNSFNTNIISTQEHINWFNKALQSANLQMFVLCDDGPVGIIRIKYIDNTAEISYSIDCEHRGQGYGAKIILLAEAEILKKHEISVIIAEAKAENIASRHIFKKLNYTEKPLNGHFEYVKKINEIVGFRVDANSNVAAGHAMRCTSIAMALAKRGASVIFFVADDDGGSFFERQNFIAVRLNTRYDNLESEVSLLKRMIQEFRLTRLVIDSYYVTSTYLCALKQSVRTIYIDDYMKSAYPVDVIINYNIYADRRTYESLYDGNCPDLLLGISYASLREDFCNVKYEVRKEASDVLVSTGGADKMHIAYKLLCKLREKNNKAYKFHFLIGILNRDIEKIEALSRDMDNVVLHINTDKVAELMQKCDVAVSAAGSTLYELCACGVPTIMFTFADNQLQGAERFACENLALYVGDERNTADLCENILKKVNMLANDYDLRTVMSKRMRSLGIGNGSVHIADELLA